MRAVLGFETVGDRVVAIKTGSGRIPCGSAIVAAGAWSGGLLDTIRVQVGSCSQWHGYRSRELFLRTDPSQQIGGVRLLP